jgi:hypothetical protein
MIFFFTYDLEVSCFEITIIQNIGNSLPEMPVIPYSVLTLSFIRTKKQRAMQDDSSQELAYKKTYFTYM